MKRSFVIVFLILTSILWSEEKISSISKNIDLTTTILRDEQNNYKGGYFSSLLFKEDETIIAEFNVDDNNPYLKLPYPYSRHNEIVPRIDLRNADLCEILPDSICNKEIKYEYERISHAFTSFHIQRFSQADSENIDHIAISYGISFLSSHDQLKYKKSTVIILNQKGEIIYTNELQGDSASQPTVTTDGKFLCIISNKSNKMDICDLSYMLFDIENNKILVEKKMLGDAVSVSFSNKTGLLSVSDRLSRETNFYFHDFSERKIYKKSYTIFEKQKIKKTTKEGIVFGIESRNDINEKIETFKEDFQSEDF